MTVAHYRGTDCEEHQLEMRTKNMADSLNTMIGNIVTEPELRFSPKGTAACSFRFVQADRVKNKQTGEFEDRTPELFFRVTIFGHEAENVVESDYKPGTRVIMTGTFRQEPEWTDKEGNVRPGNVEFIADEMGPSNRFAKATVERTRGRQSGNQPRPQNSGQSQAAPPPVNDPWGAQGQAGGQQQTASDPWASTGADVSDPWAAN